MFGIASTILGLAFVGVNAVLDSGSEEHSIGDTILGIAVTVGAQLFQATQCVFEEKFMKGKYDIPSLYIVGFEGLAGVVLCLLVSLPIVYFIPGDDHGSYENSLNSFYMMFHNPLLCCL